MSRKAIVIEQCPEVEGDWLAGIIDADTRKLLGGGDNERYSSVGDAFIGAAVLVRASDIAEGCPVCDGERPVVSCAGDKRNDTGD